MKGTNLGELEELVMLSVGILYDDAYGLAIQKEIKERCKRSITISTVHSVTSRLEEKGYLSARYDGATPERGGRRKRFYTITAYGTKVLDQSYELRTSLYKSLPHVNLAK